MRQAQRAGQQGRIFARMEQAEQLYEQEQAGGSKKARLLHKLEEGGSSGRGAAGPSGGNAAAPTDTQRQAATRQISTALANNATLAAQVGGSEQAAALAVLLEQKLADGASKAVYHSKIANLVVAIRKATASTDVPALAAQLGAGVGGGAQSDAPTRASAAAASAAAAEGAAVAAAPAQAVTADQLQTRLAEAVQLAEAASTSQAAVAAAAGALQQLGQLPVTAHVLGTTGAGRRVQKLRKHLVLAVAAAATACVGAWKSRVAAEIGTAAAAQ